MPSLIPVVSISPSPPPALSIGETHRSQKQLKRRVEKHIISGPKGRLSKGPLPLAPSNTAPQNAHIIGRTNPDGHNDFTSTYTVALGDVEIGDIGLSEILEYVSAYELESFENGCFAVEREAQEEQDAAEDELEKQKAILRKSRMGRPKGVAGYIIPGEGESDEDGTPGYEGKRSRARPSYKHLYEAQKLRRRRRKRDPDTGELMDLSSEEDNDPLHTAQSSSDETPFSRRPTKRLEFPVMLTQPKRRRRKRDPKTGELLPLPAEPEYVKPGFKPSISQTLTVRANSSGTTRVKSQPDKKKRPRRRRHPTTGVLMPLGWVYDPETDNPADSFGTHRDSTKQSNVPSFELLNINSEPEAKRRRVSLQAVSETERSSPSVDQLASSLRSRVEPKVSPRIFAADLQSSSSAIEDEGTNSTDIEMKDVADLTEIDTRNKSTDTQNTLKVLVAKPKTSMLNPLMAADLSTYGSDPEASDVPVSSQPPKTSITNPMLPETHLSTMQNEDDTSGRGEDYESELDEGEDYESELDEGEFEIEAILDHRFSDPRTHPKELGKHPVMLYNVKWVGWDEPTWEPVESFGDRKLVEEYHRDLKLKKRDKAK